MAAGKIKRGGSSTGLKIVATAALVPLLFVPAFNLLAGATLIGLLASFAGGKK